MRFIVLAAAITVVAVATVTARAAEILETGLAPPEQLITLQPLANADQIPRERSQALNGNNYTVVAPIFDGSGGNTSYIRLANANTTSATITVTIVGTPSARVYGSVNFAIPSGASQQKSIADILKAANVTPGYVAPDTGYAVYLSTSAPYLTGFQHILFNGNSRFFENMSACTFRPTIDYSPLNQIVANAHTDQEIMKDYPTVVGIHHYGSAAANYRADVYVSETGEWKGAFTFRMEANETYTTSVSWYEQGVKWTPAFGQSHTNIFFTRSDGGTYQAVVGQSVYNNALDAFVNMSQFCGINNVAGTSGGGTGGSSSATFIKSAVQGAFSGWSGNTVVTLANGQVWRQSLYHYEYGYSYAPTVIVFEDAGGYKMSVEGFDKFVGVTRVQ